MSNNCTVTYYDPILNVVLLYTWISSSASIVLAQYIFLHTTDGRRPNGRPDVSYFAQCNLVPSGTPCVSSIGVGVLQNPRIIKVLWVTTFLSFRFTLCRELLSRLLRRTRYIKTAVMPETTGKRYAKQPVALKFICAHQYSWFEVIPERGKGETDIRNSSGAPLHGGVGQNKSRYLGLSLLTRISKFRLHC